MIESKEKIVSATREKTSLSMDASLRREARKYGLDHDWDLSDVVDHALRHLLTGSEQTVEKLGSHKLSPSDQRAATAFLKWWNTPPRDEKQTAIRVAVAALLGIQGELTKEELRKLKFWTELGKD